MPRLKIRPLDEIARKYQEVTPARSTEYERGVSTPLRDWEANAVAAEKAYEEGVTDAFKDKRRTRGIRKAGNAFWQERAKRFGPGRFAESTREAGPVYSEGFQASHQVIGALDVPPRGRTGDLKNYDISRAVGIALHERKIKGS